MFFNHTHPNRELSASQMEFFRMLDEKIDLVSYHTVAHATSKLFQSFFMLTKKGKRLRLARRWNTRRWSVPVSGTGPDAAASAAARPEWGENDECGEQRRPIEFVAQRRSVDLRRQDEERRPWFQVVVQRHVQRVALASVRSRPAQRSKVHGHLKDAAKRERERERNRGFFWLCVDILRSLPSALVRHEPRRLVCRFAIRATRCHCWTTHATTITTERSHRIRERVKEPFFSLVTHMTGQRWYNHRCGLWITIKKGIHNNAIWHQNNDAVGWANDVE